MPKGEKNKNFRKWQDVFLVKIYKMTLLGFSDVDICKELKVSRQLFYTWVKENKAIDEVMIMARKERAEGERMPEWVYKRISPELKEIWDHIRQVELEPDGIRKIKLILQENGRLVRQQLFLHALCCCRFSASKALQKLHLSKRELDRWIMEDAEFARLVEEMQWHKGNFFEEMLFMLCKQGNTSAIIFANKTHNRERGYGERVKIEHSGNIMHGVVDLSEIMQMLSEGTKLELLDAIRKKDEEIHPRLTVMEKIRKHVSEVPDE